MANRDDPLTNFHAALAAVHGTRLVRRALDDIPGTVALVALGKAASAMAQGALDNPAVEVACGFVCHPHSYEPFTPPGDGDWTVCRGGHPVPDSDSFEAGAALVAWLARLPPSIPLLVLMSGGSSACIEHLREGIKPTEAVERTRALLASGADIHALNAARSEWSALKRGRALRLAGLRDVHVMVLADVPGDDPAFVGSGPFYGVSPTVVIETIGTNRMLMDAAVAAAGPVASIAGMLGGDATQCGTQVAQSLVDGGPGIQVWGGETTVKLPANPGRGGRCQQLALSAARVLDGVPGVTLLAVGSDGIDGNGEDAGAVVDGGTAARLRAAGIDIEAALATADAGTALAEIGALVHTGPTGTNLMDLVIARRCERPRA